MKIKNKSFKDSRSDEKPLPLHWCTTSEYPLVTHYSKPLVKYQCIYTKFNFGVFLVVETLETLYENPPLLHWCSTLNKSEFPLVVHQFFAFRVLQIEFLLHPSFFQIKNWKTRKKCFTGFFKGSLMFPFFN